jgi:hypothetical protein
MTNVAINSKLVSALQRHLDEVKGTEMHGVHYVLLHVLGFQHVFVADRIR